MHDKQPCDTIDYKSTFFFTYQFNASFNRLEIWLLKFWPLAVKQKSSIVNLLLVAELVLV